MTAPFDANDPRNLGRPLYFSLDAHIACVESLIRSDEIELALRVADMVPSWYRMPENYPPELRKIKQAVARQLYDQIEYANDDEEAACSREFGEAQWGTSYMYPRDQIVEKIVREINAGENKIPWIFDLGCSHGNLPLGLIKSRVGFDYKGVGLNYRIVESVREWVENSSWGSWHNKPIQKQTTILYCTEVLEHASRLEDVVTTALKECVDWDVILLSVPMHTLGGGLPNYADRRLGHVRTFNPQELFEFASKSWPGYTWELTLAASMVIVGRRG